jgi:hypothetical protein
MSSGWQRRLAKEKLQLVSSQFKAIILKNLRIRTLDYLPLHQKGRLRKKLHWIFPLRRKTWLRKSLSSNHNIAWKSHEPKRPPQLVYSANSPFRTGATVA